MKSKMKNYILKSAKFLSSAWTNPFDWHMGYRKPSVLLLIAQKKLSKVGGFYPSRQPQTNYGNNSKNFNKVYADCFRGFLTLKANGGKYGKSAEGGVENFPRSICSPKKTLTPVKGSICNDCSQPQKWSNSWEEFLTSWPTPGEKWIWIFPGGEWRRNSVQLGNNRTDIKGFPPREDDRFSERQFRQGFSVVGQNFREEKSGTIICINVSTDYDYWWSTEFGRPLCLLTEDFFMEAFADMPGWIFGQLSAEWVDDDMASCGNVGKRDFLAQWFAGTRESWSIGSFRFEVIPCGNQI